VSGLALGVHGIVGKDVRSRTRGWRPMLVLTVYLILLTVGVVGVLGITVSSWVAIYPVLGQVLFAALAGGSVMLVAFIAPGLTAGAISGERERLTLDLLLVTRASPLGLITGKLAGAMLWLIYLIVASLPALGVVYLFGGVPLSMVGAALVVTLSTALGYCALGLVLSAVIQRTAIATVVAYGIVLISTVVLPIVAITLGTAAVSRFPGSPTVRSVLPADIAFGWPPPLAWLNFASPAMALLSVLSGIFTPASAGSTLAVGAMSVYAVRSSGPDGDLVPVISLAAWVFNALINVTFAVCAVLLAAWWVTPRRRGRSPARGN
jgi:ABC-type transport system involved in multi-copper enzyme maturation permease subunit